MHCIAVTACVFAVATTMASRSGRGPSVQASTSPTRPTGLVLLQTQHRAKLNERAGRLAKSRQDAQTSRVALDRSVGQKETRRIADTSIVINASVATVWDLAAVRMSDWKDWSAVFAANIDGPPAVGKEFTIESHFPDAFVKHTTTPMKITDLEAESKICWMMNDPWLVSSSLWAKHCIHFYSRPEGGVLVHNYEDQGGAMVETVQHLMGPAVEAGFGSWNEELRAEAEGGGAGPSSRL